MQMAACFTPCGSTFLALCYCGCCCHLNWRVTTVPSTHHLGSLRQWEEPCKLGWILRRKGTSQRGKLVMLFVYKMVMIFGHKLVMIFGHNLVMIFGHKLVMIFGHNQWWYLGTIGDDTCAKTLIREEIFWHRHPLVMGRTKVARWILLFRRGWGEETIC